MPPLALPTNQHLSSSSSLLQRSPSQSTQRSTPLLLTLLKRQTTTTIIPADYSNINDSQPPGTIIGIVLGSVAGFLLILWILYTLMGGNMITAGATSSSFGGGSLVIQARKRSRRGSSRRTSRTETVEVRRERVPVPPRVERVERIVEERRTVPTATVVSESVGSEDEVVVIEEHSPPRRASGGGSRKVKEVREVREVRESGYRTVDPMAYGGGDRPLRDVERRDSRRSRDGR